jgi:hypothetical protein
MLKELILRDFGIELPIAGGNGQSLDDPILITSEEPSYAARSKLKLIDCINVMTGRYWQATTNEIFERNERVIEKLTYVSKYIVGDNVNTDTNSFYFDISNVEDQNCENPIRFGLPVSGDIELVLPYQLGWLHYAGRVDNETTSPGLGYSFIYNAPATKATVYVYNKCYKDLHHIETAKLFQDEFESAISDLLTMNPDAVFINEYSEGNFKTKGYDVGDTFTSVSLGILQNHFVKLRITNAHKNEAFEYDCMNETLRHFWLMLKHLA